MSIIPMPNAITSIFNCVTNNPHDNNPSRGIMGTLAIAKGILNGLFKSGFLYLSHNAERLTDANVMNVPKFVSPATNSRFPIITDAEDKIITISIESQGVPLVEIRARGEGNLPSRAIP